MPAGSVAITGGKLNRVAVAMMVNICELAGFFSVGDLGRGTKFVSKSDMALMRLQLLTCKVGKKRENDNEI